MDPWDSTVEVRGAAPGSGRLAVVLLHGRDQDPVWALEHVVDRLPEESITWLVPAAPGRSWYAGRVHDPLETTQAERDRAADVVDGAVAGLAGCGHEPGRVVLAGFSQGACVVADHLLRRPRRWAGALVLTGAAFGPAGTSWAGGAGSLDGLEVLATNGDADDWVPWSATEALAGVLRARGADVTLRVEPGRAHEVADGEITAVAALLRRWASS